MKAIFVLCSVLLLSGCVGQFGTRIPHPVHNASVKASAPVAAPVISLPVIAPAPVAEPVKKPTLRQRVLSKFFHKRAK